MCVCRGGDNSEFGGVYHSLNKCNFLQGRESLRVSLWFPKPFSKCRYLIINKLLELERALEAIWLKSHFTDGKYQPREGKGIDPMGPMGLTAP